MHKMSVTVDDTNWNGMTCLQINVPFPPFWCWCLYHFTLFLHDKSSFDNGSSPSRETACLLTVAYFALSKQIVNQRNYLIENEIRECEGVVEMIKEQSKGINGFNEDELLEILAYISST